MLLRPLPSEGQKSYNMTLVVGTLLRPGVEQGIFGALVGLLIYIYIS